MKKLGLIGIVIVLSLVASLACAQPSPIFTEIKQRVLMVLPDKNNDYWMSKIEEGVTYAMGYVSENNCIGVVASEQGYTLVVIYSEDDNNYQVGLYRDEQEKAIVQKYITQKQAEDFAKKVLGKFKDLPV